MVYRKRLIAALVAVPFMIWPGLGADDGSVKTDDLISAWSALNDSAGTVPEGYVKIPGEDASEEDIAAFRKAAGVQIA